MPKDIESVQEGNKQGEPVWVGVLRGQPMNNLGKLGFARVVKEAEVHSKSNEPKASNLQPQNPEQL